MDFFCILLGKEIQSNQEKGILKKRDYDKNYHIGSYL